MSAAFTLKQRFEAVAAGGLTGLLGRLDIQRASALGGRIGRWIGPRTRRDALARRNIRMALPDVDVDAVVAEMWDNLGRTFFEFPHLRGIERAPAERVEFVGGDIVRAALAEGRGVMFVTGHIANWEVMGLTPGLVGAGGVVIYRAPNNPFVRDIIQDLRVSGIRWLPKSLDATKQLVSALRAGHCATLLVDQRYNKGVAVPMFGRELMVASTPAVMARKLGCPLVPLRVERLPGVRFRITVEPPLAVDRSLPPDAFDAQAMAAVMAVLERWVRERPGQWFWVQKLWPQQ